MLACGNIECMYVTKDGGTHAYACRYASTDGGACELSSVIVGMGCDGRASAWRTIYPVRDDPGIPNFDWPRHLWCG